jgi:hypothetical protein
LLATLLLLVVCWYPTAANISDVASFPADVAANDAPLASAVAVPVGSSSVDVNSAVGVLWVPAVVVASAFASVPAVAGVTTVHTIPSTGVSTRSVLSCAAVGSALFCSYCCCVPEIIALAIVCCCYHHYC